MAMTWLRSGISHCRLVEDVRRGDGPRLLHAQTFRWTGHTSTDAAAWRDPADVEAGKARCPIARLRGTLLDMGLGQDDLDGIEHAARQEMKDARSAANAAAWPGSEIAYEDVLDTGAPAA